MNVRNCRPWKTLPLSEKEAIQRAVIESLAEDVEKNMNEAVEETQVICQKIWLKFACSLLHDNFGFTEDKLMSFLSLWKNAYRWNKRLGSEEEQDEALAAKMAECFPKRGYPEDIIEYLEKT